MPALGSWARRLALGTSQPICWGPRLLWSSSVLLVSAEEYFTGVMSTDAWAAFSGFDEIRPTELSTSAQGYGLELGSTRLSARYTASATANSSNDVGSIQANFPSPTKQLLYYFEMTVLGRGEMGTLAIGFSDKGFRCTRQPGWEANSYGYHGDDGHKFGGSGKGEEYGPLFGSDDTVGAGIIWSTRDIFFTKNGVMLKTAFSNVRGCLIPTIGLHSKGESVEVNFGQQPFKFDVEGLIADERASKQEAIERWGIGKMIRNYLLHYGYADTLLALDEDLEQGESSSSKMSVDSAEDGDCNLKLRKSVRSAINGGDIDSAIELMTASFPQLLKDPVVPVQGKSAENGSEGAMEVRYVSTHIKSATPPTSRLAVVSKEPSVASSDYDVTKVWFQLYTQKYIELVRHGKVLEAVNYAQTTLSRLRSSSLQSLDAELRDVVALIAYENPEASPLAHLLNFQRRESVADAANSILLRFGYEAKGVKNSMSTFSIKNGGLGEAFSLWSYTTE
eukprot:gene22438-29551_t